MRFSDCLRNVCIFLFYNVGYCAIIWCNKECVTLEQRLGVGHAHVAAEVKNKNKRKLTEDTETRKRGSEGRSGQLIHDYEVWAELC